MKLEIDIYHHFPQGESGLMAKLEQIISLLNASGEREIVMSKELDDLKVQATKNEDAEAAAVTLLTGLSAQITALKDDPAALAKLATDLKGSADALGAAIVANTPAADGGTTGGTTGGTGTGGATGTTGGTAGGTPAAGSTQSGGGAPPAAGSTGTV